MKLYQIARTLLVLLVVLVLYLTVVTVQAAMPDDVMDAKATTHIRPCMTSEGVKMCFLAEKNGKHYRIAYDENGLYSVHEVERIELDNGQYKVGNPRLLWVRGGGV